MVEPITSVLFPHINPQFCYTLSNKLLGAHLKILYEKRVLTYNISRSQHDYVQPPLTAFKLSINANDDQIWHNSTANKHPSHVLNNYMLAKWLPIKYFTHGHRPDRALNKDVFFSLISQCSNSNLVNYKLNLFICSLKSCRYVV